MKHTVIVLCLLSITTVERVFGQTYHSADVAALEYIRDNNFSESNLLGWTDEDPGNWIGVKWNDSEPKRVIQLDLDENGNANKNLSESGVYGRYFDFPGYYTGFESTGVSAFLEGDLDFTDFAELIALDLGSQANITGINVSGLSNLKHLFIDNNGEGAGPKFAALEVIEEPIVSGITSLDLSNLPSLSTVHAMYMGGLESIDLSNCPNLKKVKAKYNPNLTTINLDGSDALGHLCLKDNSSLTSLDLSGKTQLVKLATSGSGNVNEITGLEDLNEMIAFCIAYGQVGGSIDVSNFNFSEMEKFNIDANNIESITGIEDLLAVNSIHVLGTGDNNLSLHEIVPFDNFTGSVDKLNSENGSSQTKYGGESVLVPVSLDYSSEALIDVNGSDVATTFTLFKSGTGEISNNTTGLFEITGDANAGIYYVTMVNSGVTLTTNNIEVLAGGSSILSPSITQNFGEVYLNESIAKTLTITNSGDVSLEITDITIPTGFTISATTGVIAAGASSDFTVTFTPTEILDYSGNIDIVSDADGGNGTIALTAFGIEKVSILSKTFDGDFGEVVVGESNAQTMTLKNIGPLDLEVSNIIMPDNFSIDATTATLAEGKSKEFLVTFSPVASTNSIELYSGLIEIVSDANQGSKFHTVSGTGVSFSYMNAFLGTSFSDVEVGSSEVQALTLKNSSGVDINVTEISVPEGFSIDATSTILAAGTSKSLNLTFSPTEIKTYSGEIMITSDASAGDKSLEISGTGIAVKVLDVNELKPVVQLHPNPTTDGIIYISGNRKDMLLSVHSLTGELVKEIELSAQSNQIDVSNIKGGVYFLTSLDGAISHKFIKK